MSQIRVDPAKKLLGSVNPPPDKSISHRAVMFGALAIGTTTVTNTLMSEDVKATINAFVDLGVRIDKDGDRGLCVYGKGLKGLSRPKKPLDMANSGTTMRLMMGILSGQPFTSVLTGDESLSARPMKRVAEPLRMMGAKITGPDDANHAPITIEGGTLKPIEYSTKVASAQVKSAILLAGLYASGLTRVSEPSKSRDHTERMLKYFGCDVKEDGLSAAVTGPARLQGRHIDVPADISSAAFFMVAASILKGSSLTISSVGLNPTRTGILDILKSMGADLDVRYNPGSHAEPVGDIVVRSKELKGALIEGDLITRAIDELPVLMVAACFAQGETLIKGASELRVKETDRIGSMVEGLSRMGADIRAQGDDVLIRGGRPLKGSDLKSYKDHRTAMSLSIATLGATSASVIDDPECVAISFPGFFKILDSLKAK